MKLVVGLCTFIMVFWPTQNGLSQDQVTLLDFEDNETGGWSAVSWSDDPFSSFEVSEDWAASGTKSLKVEFGGGEWKWGVELAGLGSQDFLNQIENGGKLLVDMFIPEEFVGITHIGFVVQQPGAEENDWQQVWFEVSEKTGVFTIELPFTRENDQPITLYLGKTTNGGDSYTVYFDDFRFAAPDGGGNTNDPILWTSFETQEDIDAFIATEWSDDPFQTIERVEEQATDGDYSFRGTFGAGAWKWGVTVPNIDDEEALESIQYGGTFLLDLTVPETSEGIGHIGFAIQQPDAEQPLDWQQVWFNLNGSTGSFLIELPFERAAEGPITLHIGKNAPDEPFGDEFEVFFDNLRMVPNSAPTGPEPVIVELPVFGFEDDTLLGFGPTGFSDSPFNFFAVSEENSSEGSKSMNVEFDGAAWKWGGTISGLTDLDAMRAINSGKTLLIDVFIPEDMPGIQNIGLVLQEPDVTDSWQQVWFGIGGETGAFTVKLPYERLGSSPVNIHLGYNSEVDVSYSIFFDNLRVESEQLQGQSIPVKITSISRSGNEVTILWSDPVSSSFDLLFSENVTGPYEVIHPAIEGIGITVDIEESNEEGFFTVEGNTTSAPEIDYLFFDDLEGDLSEWETDNIETDWQSGSPSGTPANAFSGDNVFGTILEAPFNPNSFSSLHSPVIDLTEVNQTKNLFLTFRYFLDIDTDGAGAFVNLVDESGVVIAADLTILAGSTKDWKGILVAIPEAAKGTKFKIEWLFFSDDFESQGSGVFIDDIGIELAP